MGVCFAHVCFDEISTPVMRTMLTMVNVVQINISDFGCAHLCISDLKCFETFRNCSMFYRFWLLGNFYSGDVHHANYFERCSNHHFRHWAHCVYQIYSVLKLFEIPDCFAHFGFYEISTPVMRPMLTMVNVVQIISSHMAHSSYIRFIAFWKVSKLLFVLRILAFTKFPLRWCPPR